MLGSIVCLVVCACSEVECVWGVCLGVYTWGCVHVWVYVHAWVYVFRRVHVWDCVHVWGCVQVLGWVFGVCTWGGLHVWVCVRVCFGRAVWKDLGPPALLCRSLFPGELVTMEAERTHVPTSLGSPLGKLFAYRQHRLPSAPSPLKEFL